MITCIIAEKPSVARDIAKNIGARKSETGYIEGNNYIVTWAMGHLIAHAMPQAYGYDYLNERDLPICPKDFKITPRKIRQGKEYVDDPAALKQLKVIKECFKRCDNIIVATDAGREGELIFRYIYSYLNCNKPFQRLWISSLTDKAIQEGMQHLKDGHQYDKLYQSAKSRSEADWLIGINASRALSIAQNGSYSLGRVQTPTLAMVCKRYLENKNFTSLPYWKVNTIILKDNIEIKLCGEKHFETQSSADFALHQLEQNGLCVNNIVKKKVSVQPPLLYDLTTLQKEANKRYGFTADKTLSTLQSLYEKKITTYPRTGSRYISEDVFAEIPTICKALGYTLPSYNPHSVDNDKVTDHHAIIHTGEYFNGLSTDEVIIYTMICERFKASFSPASEEEHLNVEFSDGEQNYKWKGIHIINGGWKALEKEEIIEDDKEIIEQLNILPNFKEGEHYKGSNCSVTEHKSKPKPLYTEATLLSSMEHAGKEIEDKEHKKALSECGIGTPATRANIIETLILREYIRREKKNLIPTDKGMEVYEIVKDKKIANAEMTGIWELSLEGIEEGKVDTTNFMQGIENYTHKICSELLSERKETKETLHTCPKCHNESVRIYQKVVKCNQKECGFHIFREVCGAYLTEENIHELIGENRKTAIIKGMKSKTGKKFNARIALNEEFTTIFEFEPPKKK